MKKYTSLQEIFDAELEEIRNPQSKVVPFTIVNIGGPDKIEAYRLARKAIEAKWQADYQERQAAKREASIDNLLQDGVTKEEFFKEFSSIYYSNAVNLKRDERYVEGVKRQQREEADSKFFLDAPVPKLSWFEKIKKLISSKV